MAKLNWMADPNAGNPTWLGYPDPPRGYYMISGFTNGRTSKLSEFEVTRVMGKATRVGEVFRSLAGAKTAAETDFSKR